MPNEQKRNSRNTFQKNRTESRPARRETPAQSGIRKVKPSVQSGDHPADYRQFEYRQAESARNERSADQNEYILTGRNPIREALKNHHDLEKLLVQKGELSGSAREIVQKAKEQKIQIQVVEKVRLDAIAPNHQGLIAFASAYQYSSVDEILQYIISCGKCLEVNTAGYKYGFMQPHPAPEILRRYYELGGRLLTIGADAHRPEHIAFAYDKAEALLRSVGFTDYCVFEGRRMRKIQF